MALLSLRRSMLFAIGFCCIPSGLQAQTGSMQLRGPNSKNAADYDVSMNPVEVGLVHWNRDFELAQSRSAESGKPLFVLFQEVPGCAGCQQFGKTVLTHPLIVEAIEEEFEPVLVFNNRSSGSDETLRQKFGEPAWNYQVIRFLTEEGKDIIPRKERVWTIPSLVERMVQVLEEQDRPVPKYLQALNASTHPKDMEQVAFAMYCFWTGEAALGKIEGVVATEAGFLEGREVTLVRYDSEQATLEDITAEASKVKCADKIFTMDGVAPTGTRLATGKLTRAYRTAPVHDQKRQVMNWRQLKMTPGLNVMQLTKVNSLIHSDRDAALEWLSPRQRTFLLGENGTATVTRKAN